MTITQARLKQVLHYDPQTGVFTWLVNISTRNRIGDIAGTLRSDGYIRLQIDGVRKYASHWAYLYMNGEYPRDEVDHEDRDRANNAWFNLRPSTKSQNSANRPKRVRESGLLRGVTRRNGRFVSQIRAHGVHRYLGVYTTEQEAHEAYSIEAIKAHGEFSVLHQANDNVAREVAA